MKSPFLSEDEWKKLVEINEAFGDAWLRVFRGYVLNRDEFVKALKKTHKLINELVA